MHIWKKIKGDYDVKDKYLKSKLLKGKPHRMSSSEVKVYGFKNKLRNVAQSPSPISVSFHQNSWIFDHKNKKEHKRLRRW